MAIEKQKLIETFNSELQTRLAFILAGAFKSTKIEGQQGDAKINMRVIDPTRVSTQYDSASVGSNSNSVSFASLKEKVISLPLHHSWRAIEEKLVNEAASMNDEQLRQHIKKTAQDMAEDIVERRVGRDICSPNGVFVGDWKALKKAAAYLKSIGCGNLFGFVNPEIPADVADKWIANDKVGGELFDKNALGKGGDGVDYYSERYMPSIVIPTDTTWAKGSFTISDGAITALTMTATVTSGADPRTLKKGTPILLDGAVVCDGLGNPTTKKAYVILNQDVTGSVSSTTETFTLTSKFDAPILTGAGRQICDDDGTDLASADVIGVSTLAGGVYNMGVLRADGCVAVGSITKFDIPDAETGVDVFDGVSIYSTRFTDKSVVDVKDMRRFDNYMAHGFIDSRLSVIVYVKEAA